MTAPMGPPIPSYPPNLRPLLVMEPELAPVFARTGEPFRVVDDVPWSGLDAALRAAPATALVVVQPYAGTRPGERFPWIRELLRRFPSVPVVAAMELPPELAPDVAMLLEWGVAEVVDLAREAPRAIRARLCHAHASPFKRALRRTLSPYAGVEARRILLAAAEVAAEGGQAPELARHLSVSPKTLAARCARADLPPPRQVQAWMRMLLACLLLDDPGRTVYGAAYASGYSTERSLRRAITAHLGVDSTTLRKAGAFATAAGVFNAALRDARETARDRRKARE